VRPTPSVSAACTCSRPPYSDKRVVVDCRSAQGPVPKAARLSSLGRSFLRKGHSPSCLPLSLLAFTSPFYSLLSTAPIHFDNPLGLLNCKCGAVGVGFALVEMNERDWMEWRNDTISEMMMREQGDGRPTHTERWMERERGRGQIPLVCTSS